MGSSKTDGNISNSEIWVIQRILAIMQIYCQERAQSRVLLTNNEEFVHHSPDDDQQLLGMSNS